MEGRPNPRNMISTYLNTTSIVVSMPAGFKAFS